MCACKYDASELSAVRILSKGGIVRVRASRAAVGKERAITERNWANIVAHVVTNARWGVGGTCSGYCGGCGVRCRFIRLRRYGCGIR